MSVKDDQTPVYHCPVCFSPLYLDDRANGIWRCTNASCLRVRDVVVKIETLEVSARWAFEDEQDLKNPYRKGKGRSGRRHKVRRPKPRRWYEIDRSAIEHGKQKASQDLATTGPDPEGEAAGCSRGTEPLEGDPEAT